MMKTMMNQPPKLARQVMSCCIQVAVTLGTLVSTTMMAHAVDNKKIMPYGLYQTPDKAIWMRCALGQTWENNTCTGEAKEYTWQEAQEIAKSYNYKTQKNWRLPTIAELHGIVECSTGFNEKARIPTSATKKKLVDNLCNEGADKPTLNQTLFPNSPDGLFWSSTTDSLQNGFAWYTYFGGGYSHIYNMESKNYVRLVKDPIKLASK